MNRRNIKKFGDQQISKDKMHDKNGIEGTRIFTPQNSGRTEEQYRQDVYNFFIELQEVKTDLLLKYNVRFLTDDQEKDLHEFCYDPYYEYPDLRRKDIIKNPKDYKEAHKLGMGASKRIPEPWDGIITMPYKEVCEILGKDYLALDNSGVRYAIISTLEMIFRKQGLQYIKENVESLRDQAEHLIHFGVPEST